MWRARAWMNQSWRIFSSGHPGFGWCVQLHSNAYNRKVVRPLVLLLVGYQTFHPGDISSRVSHILRIFLIPEIFNHLYFLPGLAARFAPVRTWSKNFQKLRSKLSLGKVAQYMFNLYTCIQYINFKVQYCFKRYWEGKRAAAKWRQIGVWIYCTDFSFS